MKSFDLKELLTSKAILTVKTTKTCMFSCILYVPVKVWLHYVNFIWKQGHLTTLTYHYKYIIPLLYKIFHSFADNPSHTVPQALAIASELAISLRRWSNIDNWHAECDFPTADKSSTKAWPCHFDSDFHPNVTALKSLFE